MEAAKRDLVVEGLRGVGGEDSELPEEVCSKIVFTFRRRERIAKPKVVARAVLRDRCIARRPDR